MANQGKAFPFYLISSVESGEEGGTLDEVMTRMSNYFEKQYKTARQVQNAMMYPLILACLCIGVVTLLLIVVVPRFLSMYSSQGAELPKPTQILIGVTNFIIYKWWVVALIVGAIIGIITLIKTLPSTRLSWDKFMLNMPVIGKLRCILVTSKFAHTMSTLSSSGISMLISLDVVSRVINNSYVSECVKIIIDDLKRGVPLSDSIKKFEIFPMMFKSMIAVGEESGELDELLEKTAVFYEDEADAAVKKMVALVEPLMIIIMAIIIAFVVISILLPIYTMYKNML
jgi:type IV pilus assembly protein PilC